MTDHLNREAVVRVLILWFLFRMVAHGVLDMVQWAGAWWAGPAWERQARWRLEARARRAAHRAIGGRR